MSQEPELVSRFAASRAQLSDGVADLPGDVAGIVAAGRHLVLMRADCDGVRRTDLWVHAAGGVVGALPNDPAEVGNCVVVAPDLVPVFVAQLVGSTEPVADAEDTTTITADDTNEFLRDARVAGAVGTRFVLGATSADSGQILWQSGAAIQWGVRSAGSPIQLDGRSPVGWWSAVSSLLQAS